MNVFDLAAKITLDDKEYNSKLDGAFGKLQSVGSKIGSGLATAAKVGAAAVGAAATAVGTLAAKSVSAYAEYEQMVGGVKKLYGNMGMSLEDYAKSQGKTTDEVKTQWETLGKAQDMVLKNAQNAYKTAGMSANQYMATATSFSAALINSLNGDTVKAAEATDVAMTAIADNWNTFGGDIGMIQNAFQGFAKKNYMMLDNLKLGYGGTKTEMERLIKDANEYAKSIGQAGDLSIDSFADVVTAIDLVQQKQQIAGTTAREASTTIQGSLGMVKAAWENLMVGMADGNADLDKMMGNLVDSITGYTDETGQRVNGLIDNILPVAEKALASVSTMIEKLAPMIGNELPKLVNTVLPSLLSAGAEIVSALGKGLLDTAPVLLEYVGDLLNNLLHAMMDFDFSSATSSMIDSLSDIGSKLDDIWEVGLAIVNELYRGIAESMPVLMEAGENIIMSMVNDILDELPIFIDTGATLLTNIAEGIAQALPQLVNKAVEIIQTIGEGIIKNLPMLMQAGVEVILGFVKAITDPSAISAILKVGIDLLVTLVDGIINALPQVIEAAPMIIENLVTAITENLPMLINTGIELIGTLVEAILTNLPLLTSAAIQIVFSLLQGIIQNLPTLLTVGPQMILQIITSIISSLPEIVTNGVKIVESLIEGIVKTLGSIFQAGIDLIQRFIDGILGKAQDLIATGRKVVEKVGEGIKAAWGQAKEWGNELISKIISGIEEKIGEAKEKLAGLKDAMKGAVSGDDKNSNSSSGGHSFGTSPVAPINPETSVQSFNETMSAEQSDMIYASEGSASLRPIVVEVSLEGDADRLFRVMQVKANTEYQITGKPAFA